MFLPRLGGSASTSANVGCYSTLAPIGTGLMLAALLLLTLLATPAPAVLIDAGDGTGNTTAPSPDPGWNHIGLRGSLSAVYLGNSYVITASHTGIGDVVLNAITHRAVRGTDVRLQNPDGSFADLLVFSIYPAPALPTLAISAVTPAAGEDLILAGNGRDRGPVTSFDPNGPLPPGPIAGYLWGGSQSMRWGTNQVDSFGTITLDGSLTESFSVTFDAGATSHEATATAGDSGGAAFHESAGRWELAGILFAVGQFEGQAGASSLYGNPTHAVDLSFYRDDILAVVALPEPVGGLLWGAVVLLGLRNRRSRR